MRELERNEIVRKIIANRRPRDEFARFVVTCVSQQLKETHGDVGVEIIEAERGYDSVWSINGREVVVLLETEELKRAKEQPYAIDDKLWHSFRQEGIVK
ncbi:hypothetical protein [Exiguobacterium artemiae]|uniref:hypothetical protein n=1 Tax=Exiguobacterium artemiae TaxID=340145 RepID=UPI0029644E07|nr:hypothetical protein [Exiguobacterium sibiricum]MDW2885703.1 hypothetical protein [Exiguobacterium sibiricum]